MCRLFTALAIATATLVSMAPLATAEVVVYGEGGLSFSHEDDWVFSIGVSNHGSWLWQRGGTGEATVQTQSVTDRIVVDFAVDGPPEHDHILVVDDGSGLPRATVFVDAVRGEVIPIFSGSMGDTLAFDFWPSNMLRAEVIVPAAPGVAALIVHNLQTGASVTAAAPESVPDPFVGPVRLSFFTGYAGQIFVLRVEISGESVVPAQPATWSGVRALYR
jgi:hypothetical protein